MAGNEKYSLQFGQKFYEHRFYALAVCSVLLLVVLVSGFKQTNPVWNMRNKALSTVEYTDDNASLISKQLLSDSDKNIYKQIFKAQKSADWAKADDLIDKLKNHILLGDVMAERYLHRHYETSASEIVDWLKNYSDYSQAADIIELASHKFPALFSNLPKVEKRSLQGYGDGNSEEVRFDNNPQARKLWQYGLEAWRSGKKPDAAKFFSTLADKQNGLSDWQYSAASYWAYRSYLGLGDKGKANNYLVQAAKNSHVFYGILARKQLNQSLDLDMQPIEISDHDLDKFLERSKIQRIIALAQSGLTERAENKIRFLFPSASKQEKWALLYLANHLDLASVQISMAKQLESSDRGLDMLKYPVPAWQPDGGFRVDPALIYALMRQESGFHSAAKSAGGALGLMQLMPNTAKKMQEPDIMTSEIGDNFSEPVLNITLGERYVEHLLNSDLVDGNLFYMLAAYNAGIGRLKEWQKSIAYNDDPLLFVESIPYSETRYYVMQVMTNYWIYSELAGTPSQSVFSVLHNSWPSYAAINLPNQKSSND